MTNVAGKDFGRAMIGPILVSAVLAIAQPPPQTGETLVKGSDCSSCHAVDRQIVGPAYDAIAKRYARQNDAPAKLATRIREGSSGNWGTIAMPSHKDLTERQSSAIVAWILSLQSTSDPGTQTETKLYSYTLKDGKTAQLDFPLFAEGASPKVTKSVFRGYELFNSYCFRCHGQDATGGQLAPDLRRSLTANMTHQEFLNTSMAGRKDKGMPSWAGFLSEQEVNQIYQYVKGRSLDLVPSGRPPSEAD